MPATLTAPKSTTPRGCWWLIRPEAMIDGRLIGALGIRVGRKSDFYRAVRVEADDMGQRWELAKELPSGCYAEPYTVRLPVGYGTPVCSCPGWRYSGSCRHSLSLTALVG